MLEQFSDVEQIFIVVAVLYALELIIWARGNSYVISSQWGNYRLRTERSVLSNDRGRLYFSGVFPWDATFLVQCIPLSMDAHAVSNIVVAAPGWNERSALEPQGLQYADTERLRIDNYHWMDGDKVFCSLASPMTAKRLLARLRDIRQSDDQTRLRLISDQVASQFDITSILERISLWNRVSIPLAIIGTLLFIWVFGVGLGLALGLIPQPGDFLPILVGYLVVLFALWWTNVMMTYRAHKRLYPTLGADRAVQTFVTLVSPVAAMRGRDHLARHLFECVHPLPVLYALNSPQTTPFAAVAARDAAYPLPLAVEFADDLSEQAFEAIGAYHETYRDGLDKCIQAVGFKPAELLAPLQTTDEETLAYCQRCLHEFGSTAARCLACGGRAAEPIGNST